MTLKVKQDGPYSDVVSVWVTPQYHRGEDVTGLQTRVYTGGIELSWSVPLDTGYSPIEVYRIEHSVNGGAWTFAGVSYDLSPGVARFYDTTVAGSTYSYRVMYWTEAGYSSVGPYSVASTPVVAI